MAASKENKRDDRGNDNCTGTTLPDDVIFRVLCKLPTESLLRFRCACKLWCNVPATCFFMEAHAKVQSPRILFLSDHEYGSGKLYLLDEEHIKSCAIPLATPTFPTTSNLQIHGSCNGFLCIRTSSASSSRHRNQEGRAAKGSFTVYNPITRESITLPQGPPVDDDMREGYYRVAFGLDPSSMKYKVVVMIEYENDEVNAIRCEIITVDAKQLYWRKLRVPSNYHGPPLRQYVSLPSAYFEGGALVMDGEMYLSFGDLTSILSLDISSETLQLIPSPSKTDYKKSPSFPKLENLGGRLALVEFERKPESLSVWFLEDKGRNNSWTKKYRLSIDRLLFYTQPNHFRVHRIGEHLVPALHLMSTLFHFRAVVLHALMKGNSTIFSTCLRSYSDDDGFWNPHGVAIKWITTEYLPALTRIA